MGDIGDIYVPTKHGRTGVCRYRCLVTVAFSVLSHPAPCPGPTEPHFPLVGMAIPSQGRLFWARTLVTVTSLEDLSLCSHVSDIFALQTPRDKTTLLGLFRESIILRISVSAVCVPTDRTVFKASCFFNKLDW